MMDPVFSVIAVCQMVHVYVGVRRGAVQVGALHAERQRHLFRAHPHQHEPRTVRVTRVVLRERP